MRCPVRPRAWRCQRRPTPWLHPNPNPAPALALPLQEKRAEKKEMKRKARAGSDEEDMEGGEHAAGFSVSQHVWRGLASSGCICPSGMGLQGAHAARV